MEGARVASHPYGRDDVPGEIPTPYTGANRIRFEGLRAVRTLSAWWRSPVVWPHRTPGTRKPRGRRAATAARAWLGVSPWCRA